MEYLNKLVESPESIEIRNRSISMGHYENKGFRVFDSLKFNDVELSIQCSYSHYCWPRKTIDLEDYDSMELAIFKNNRFVDIKDITNDKEIISRLNDHYGEGGVYGFVPVELIEKLYQNLIRKQKVIDSFNLAVARNGEALRRLGEE